MRRHNSGTGQARRRRRRGRPPPRGPAPGSPAGRGPRARPRPRRRRPGAGRTASGRRTPPAATAPLRDRAGAPDRRHPDSRARRLLGGQGREPADELVDAARGVADGDHADDAAQVAALGGDGEALPQQPLGLLSVEPEPGGVDDQLEGVEAARGEAEAVAAEHVEAGQHPQPPPGVIGQLQGPPEQALPVGRELLAAGVERGQQGQQRAGGLGHPHGGGDPRRVDQAGADVEQRRLAEAGQRLVGAGDGAAGARGHEEEAVVGPQVRAASASAMRRRRSWSPVLSHTSRSNTPSPSRARASPAAP
jgi:hypothetical protein